MNYFEVSAKTAQNVNEVFIDISMDLNKMSQNMEMMLGMDDQIKL